MRECSSVGGLATKHTASVILFGQLATSILGSGLSVTKLFNLPLQLIALFFHARLAALTRAQLSRSRHKRGSWLPVFDHELAPEVLPTMLERPPLLPSMHVELGRIPQPDQLLQILIRVLSQKGIVHVPHEGASLSRLPLVCHLFDGSCESSTQISLSFGSTSGFTFS